MRPLECSPIIIRNEVLTYWGASLNPVESPILGVLYPRSVQRAFKSDITYLAILNPETNIIDFPYQDGDSMPPMTYGEGLTSQIIKTGEPLLMNKDVDIAATYEKFGVAETGIQAI